MGIGVSRSTVIDEPYAYPELSSEQLLAGPMETLPLLQVPEDTLARMTTSALVETVLDFPYFGNFIASNRIDGGVDLLRSQCNALDELLDRDDAEVEIRAAYDRTQNDGWPAGTEYPTLKTGLLEALLQAL